MRVHVCAHAHVCVLLLFLLTPVPELMKIRSQHLKSSLSGAGLFETGCPPEIEVHHFSSIDLVTSPRDP